MRRAESDSEGGAGEARRWPRRERLAVGIVVAVVLLVPASIGWYEWSRRSTGDADGVEVVDITGVAGRGAWTVQAVHGLNYWWKAFEPATIHLELGQRVVLRFRSADVFHQFYVPELGVGPVDVEPGKIAEVALTADRAGVFQYYCTSMCGGCHFYMRGWIVVSRPGEKPPEPDPLVCPLCPVNFGDPPEGDPLLLGEYLYQRMGCVTCHGFEGRGGVVNYNYISETVPAHDTTAAKLFLLEQEDAEAFVGLIVQGVDLDHLEEPPDIARFRLVMARFKAAEELIRGGKNAARLDLDGPEPPLQMPVWKDKLTAEEIDAVLGYFISLYRWDEDEESGASLGGLE